MRRSKRGKKFTKEQTAMVLLSAAIVVLLVLIALLIRRDKVRSENGVIEAVDENIPDEVITGDDIIKDYLVPAGFGTIGSEWWHFQDNETRAALRPIALSDGLSIEGWKMDENGWRYRNADGSYRE